MQLNATTMVGMGVLMTGLGFVLGAVADPFENKSVPLGSASIAPDHDHETIRDVVREEVHSLEQAIARLNQSLVSLGQKAEAIAEAGPVIETGATVTYPEDNTRLPQPPSEAQIMQFESSLYLLEDIISRGDANPEELQAYREMTKDLTEDQQYQLALKYASAINADRIDFHEELFGY